MSQPLVITIPHSLGKEEATNRLKNGLAKATATLPILSVTDETWVGDTMSFKLSAMGQEAAGSVAVADSDVRIELVLPWLLQRFAEMIQQTISSKGRILLEKK